MTTYIRENIFTVPFFEVVTGSSKRNFNAVLIINWKKFSFLLIFMFSHFFSQETVTGHITDDNGADLNSVIVINIASDQKVYSNSMGMFSIEAAPNDELRFVRADFRRVSVTVPANGFNAQLLVTLIPIPKEIEEVKVVKKPTGDLETDSRLAARVNKGEIVQQAIGLPQPVGKMREKPAEVKQVLLPILLGSLDVQGAYDLISGKARRQKRQYRYDDLQEHIAWVRNRVDNEYFTKAGIPEERISEFIQYSFEVKPQVRTYVKAKNLSGVLLRMEETIPAYLERLKQKKIQE
ncbi:carboxypeptidase regulatory-like domain-containing protein [Chryseobacterium oranimense]|uniref:carboxypeptidase regulatory-like domain-containing protein n=1 Tax=Chryseobacterium oranimense TaxID=421058 RepID=UPI0021B03911|nr:carboxypeptidase regulatory-like domain-containing protein [Chryseobacterium oranimense]UWX59331.1 carboxypeptidase regulatory-like domain-containing protein [Chryseobacterium oranimense]